MFTNLEKYGTACVFANDKIKNKIKNSLLNNYGVDNPQKSDVIKSKTAQTCLNKYGVLHYCESTDFNVKKYLTWEANYGKGIVNPSQAVEVKNRKENTYQIHFGVKNPSLVPEIRSIATVHMQDTFLNKYGTKYITQVPIVKAKIVNTNLKKYGVPYYCLHKNCQLNANNSKPNQLFENSLKAAGIFNYEREFRLDKYSYDFKVNNILIEVDPSATHNSTWGIKGKPGLTKFYHYNKSKFAEKYGYRCIHIFDWDNMDKIITMLKPRERIQARKCQVKEVLYLEANNFINKYHIQGDTEKSDQDIRIGLYYNNELISIMTFGKPHYDKNYQYELLRYCSSKLVIGGANKIFNYFIKNYFPSSIISYCDLNKFNGNIYEKLNFKLQSIKIFKHWYNLKTKEHRITSLLDQKDINNKFVEIYDAGQAVYIWKKIS